jgi:hypothetical protein
VETNDSTAEHEALTKGEPDVNDRPCANPQDGSPGILSSSTHQAEIADASSDAVPGGTMHIHRPKPLHGLREILVEIGVIVIGVMIALAAEQWVEWTHWQERVRTGRREIHAEVAVDAVFYGFRATTEPSVVRRLNQLAEITEARAAGMRVAPVHFVGIHLGFLGWFIPMLVTSPTCERSSANTRRNHSVDSIPALERKAARSTTPSIASGGVGRPVIRVDAAHAARALYAADP